jgi:hypothetical protein
LCSQALERNPGTSRITSAKRCIGPVSSSSVAAVVNVMTTADL